MTERSSSEHTRMIVIDEIYEINTAIKELQRNRDLLIGKLAQIEGPEQFALRTEMGRNE